jgi:hypothetical protein
VPGVPEPTPDPDATPPEPPLDVLTRAVADHGNLLTFCDGFTIVPGQSAYVRRPLEGWVGVSIEPAHYVDATEDLRSLLGSAGIPKFRLDDVVNGRKEWARRSADDRLHWVEVFCQHALHWIKRVDVLMLDVQEQGTMERLKLAEPDFSDPGLGRRTTSTESSFVRLLVGRLVLDNPGRLLVLVTEDTNRWKIVSQRMSLPPESVLTGQPLNLPMSEVIGLQLADLCAYVVNRAHRQKLQAERSTEPGPFDALIVGFWDTLETGCRTFNLRLDIPGVSPSVLD